VLKASDHFLTFSATSGIYKLGGPFPIRLVRCRSVSLRQDLNVFVSTLDHLVIDIMSVDFRITRLQVLVKERVSSVLKRVARDFALVPEDWVLYHGSKRLDETRAIDQYELITPNDFLDLKRKEGENPKAETTQHSSPPIKDEFSLDPDALDPASPASEPASPRSKPVSEPANPPSELDPAVNDLDVKAEALLKLNNASVEFGLATIEKREVMACIAKATDIRRRLEERLEELEADGVQASKRVTDAEQAMRSACETMDMALGGGTA